LHLEHLVLDFNGTLARDGVLIPGVAERLSRVAERLSTHVVSGDTFGTAASALAGMPCKLTTLDRAGQAEAKLAYVQALGCERTVCIGNGHNDRLILATVALGIAVVESEGTAQGSLA
jgi:soluble P-type ATPase